MPVGSPPRNRALLALALIVPLGLYAALAGWLLRAGVGYEMDEALYVESAVYLLRGSGAPPFVHEPGSWVTVAGRFLPLMIIPYVGATKAYFALPLFAVFGIGPEVARLSGVLLAGLGIAGIVVLIASRGGAAAGLLAGALLAIHPSFLDLTVFDNGGAAVWMGATGLLALALTHHLRRLSAASAFLLGFAAGLAVWSRLNLLWLLAAAAAAALLVFGRRSVPPRDHAAAMLAGGLLGSLPLIVYEAGSRLGTLRFIADTRRPLSGSLIGHRLRTLAEVLVSDREQRVIWGGPPISAAEAAVGAALFAGVLLAAIAPARSDVALAPWRRAFALTAIFLTAILSTSRLGIQAHHWAGILPPAFGALALSSVELVRRSRRTLPWLAAAGAGLAALFLSWDLRIADGLRRTGGRRAFSSAIDDVAAYLGAHPVPPDRLKILNWGFQNNLYVISAGRVFGTELFGGPSKAVSRRGVPWEEEIRGGGSFLLFLFPMGPPPLSDAAEGFAEALARHPGPYHEKVFLERSGIPYARIVEIAPAR
jgi:hypothetical protein